MNREEIGLANDITAIQPFTSWLPFFGSECSAGNFANKVRRTLCKT